MSDSQTVKDRLLVYIKYLGIGQSKFEKLCGLSNGYINNSKGNFGSAKIEDILKACDDLNRSWLLTGEGEMLNSGIEQSVKGGSGNEETEIEHVRLLPLFAHGGSLSDFTVSVKDSDCEKVVSPVKGADFAIQVTGDSMAPEYPSGSVILIKKINESAFIEWGKAYVLDIPKETIAAALGHGGNTVTDIYIDFDRRKVDEANRRVLDWVLYGKK